MCRSAPYVCEGYWCLRGYFLMATSGSPSAGDGDTMVWVRVLRFTVLGSLLTPLQGCFWAMLMVSSLAHPSPFSLFPTGAGEVRLRPCDAPGSAFLLRGPLCKSAARSIALAPWDSHGCLPSERSQPALISSSPKRSCAKLQGAGAGNHCTS